MTTYNSLYSKKKTHYTSMYSHALIGILRATRIITARRQKVRGKSALVKTDQREQQSTKYPCTQTTHTHGLFLPFSGKFREQTRAIAQHAQQPLIRRKAVFHNGNQEDQIKTWNERTFERTVRLFRKPSCAIARDGFSIAAPKCSKEPTTRTPVWQHKKTRAPVAKPTSLFEHCTHPAGTAQPFAGIKRNADGGTTRRNA